LVISFGKVKEIGVKISVWKKLPIAVAAQSEAWVYGRSLAVIAGAECMFLVSVVCCQVEVSATGRSRVERSPIECHQMQ
jgi:hypothetical protein